MSDINYAEQPVPDDVPPDEYTYIQRRAELYRMLEEAGHPRNLSRSQTELGDRYGVSQRQISKDFQKLREYRRRNCGTNTVSTTEFVAEKAVRQAAENGDFAKALQLQLDYNEWLFELGALDREPNEVQLSGDAGEAYMAMLKKAAGEDAADGDTDGGDGGDA